MQLGFAFSYRRFCRLQDEFNYLAMSLTFGELALLGSEIESNLGTLDANELARQIPVGLGLFVYLPRQPVKVRIERAHHNTGMLHQTAPMEPQEVKPVLRQKAPPL